MTYMPALHVYIWMVTMYARSIQRLAGEPMVMQHIHLHLSGSNEYERCARTRGIFCVRGWRRTFRLLLIALIKCNTQELVGPTIVIFSVSVFTT